MDNTLSTQVNQMVAENQHLRVKSENDDVTIRLMKEQYDALAASVDGLRNKHDRESYSLRTERDQAVRSFKEIDTTLMIAADLIMQALRARQGDSTPDHIPDRPALHINDERLPLHTFNS
jgi:hypothetical protein